MTHPLTDDIIESELATPAHFTSGSLVGLFTHDDMRAAYTKGSADMLEKVTDFIAADPMLGRHVKDYIYKAMRQEDN